MKKILVVLLVGLMVFNFSACGSSDKDEKEAEKGNSASQDVSDSYEDDMDMVDGYYDINIVDYPGDDINIIDAHDDVIGDIPDENDSEASNSGIIGNYKTILLQNFECSGSYEGELNEGGLPDGQGTYNGTYVSSKGTTITFNFSGSFVDGKASGYGESMEYFTDGHTRKYEGTFADGNFNGDGRITAEYQGDDPYTLLIEAPFVNGDIEGTGKRQRIYENGNYYTYEGEFKKSAFNGKGTYVEYMNGNTTQYEGDFKNGKREGEGAYILYTADGEKQEYSGGFKNEEFSGSGSKLVTFSEENSAETGVYQVFYEGTFEKGLFSGSDNTLYIYYTDGDVLVRNGVFSAEEFVSGVESLLDESRNVIYSYSF